MYLLLVCLFATALAKPLQIEHVVNPEEEGEYYQGDILLPPGLAIDDLKMGPFNAIIGSRYRWPNNELPYEITPGEYSATQIAQIEAGVAEINQRSNCLRVVPYTTQGDYAFVEMGGGCSSYIGRIGGSQRISLDPGCFSHGTIVHEFLHAIGFYHEQSRGDRDDFVVINWDNILPGRENNFRMEVEGVTIDHLGTDYDYGSCMHYGAYGFAIDRSIPTIDPIWVGPGDIGQRQGPSATDMQRVNNLYTC